MRGLGYLLQIKKIKFNKFYLNLYEGFDAYKNKKFDNGYYNTKVILKMSDRAQKIIHNSLNFDIVGQIES